MNLKAGEFHYAERRRKEDGAVGFTYDAGYGCTCPFERIPVCADGCAYGRSGHESGGQCYQAFIPGNSETVQHH